MKIKSEQLPAKLKNELSAAYLISGDDFFLKEEAQSLIRKKCIEKKSGERVVFSVDTHFQWDSLFDEALSYSLFSAKKLIELQFTQGKFSQEIKNKLEELLRLALTDITLLISCPKLDASSIKGKWYSVLNEKGLHVEIWPIDERQLPRWIEQRLQAAKLPTDKSLVEAIALLTAGNLLATQQEIDKLSLLSGTTTTFIAALTESMRHTSFDFVAQALQGNLKNARNILTHLQAESSEIVLILWAISQEIRCSQKVLYLIQRGQSFQSACETLQIWPKRRIPIQQYINRFSLPGIYQHLQQCSHIDKLIKGFYPGDPWFKLLELTSKLCGVPVCSI